MDLITAHDARNLINSSAKVSKRLLHALSKVRIAAQDGHSKTWLYFCETDDETIVVLESLGYTVKKNTDHCWYTVGWEE